MAECRQCGREVVYPFQCSFCGDYFYAKHRLPENHSCPNQLSNVSVKLKRSQKSEPSVEEGKFYFIKRREKKYSRPKGLSGLTRLRPRKLLASLIIWLPVFWVSVGAFFILEKGNPVDYYQSVSNPAKYFLYAFASVIGLWSGYEIFKKCDYNPSSDSSIFALKLLSAGVFVAATFILLFGIYLMSGTVAFVYGLSTEVQISLAREITSIFLMVFSLVLLVLSTYLMFKFERRSGIIVYRR